MTDAAAEPLPPCGGGREGAAPAGAVFAERISAAAADVLAERRRQVEAEGWTPSHDDGHKGGELALAAACYAHVAAIPGSARAAIPAGWPPAMWPWDYSWWKPSTPRRDLVKAAALLLAEIERIDRLAAEHPTAHCPLPTAEAR